MRKFDKENGGNVRRYRSTPILNKINNEVYFEGKLSDCNPGPIRWRNSEKDEGKKERSKSFVSTSFLRSSTNEKADSAPLKLAKVEIEQRTASSSFLQVHNARTTASNQSLNRVSGDESPRINGNISHMTQAYSVSRGPADPDGSAGAPLATKNFESTELIQASCPSKARQKKFHRHFKQVDVKEKVLNYYSCALVGDILLQGHLYITENFFAFYSNVFGYVTKLLIPMVDVLKISKEKTAKIIPNAVGISTEDEKHVFGSLLSRDSTYKFMVQVWKAANSSNPVVTITPPASNKTELQSDEDSSVSTGNEESPSYIGSVTPGTSPENFQKLLPGLQRKSILLTALEVKNSNVNKTSFVKKAILVVSFILLVLLFASAGYLLYRIATIQQNFNALSISSQSSNIYEEILKWQSTLHSTSANKVYDFLNANLNQITKVRLSLEALSMLILPRNKSEKPNQNSKWESTKIKESKDGATMEKDSK